MTSRRISIIVDTIQKCPTLSGILPNVFQTRRATDGENGISADKIPLTFEEVKTQGQIK
jgi:hypothetical protein